MRKNEKIATGTIDEKTKKIYEAESEIKEAVIKNLNAKHKKWDPDIMTMWTAINGAMEICFIKGANRVGYEVAVALPRIREYYIKDNFFENFLKSKTYSTMKDIVHAAMQGLGYRCIGVMGDNGILEELKRAPW